MCKDDIRISIENQIKAELAAGKSWADINIDFKALVINEAGDINIPQELINKYWEINKPTDVSEDRITEIYESIKNIQTKASITKVSDAGGYIDKDGNTLRRITDNVKTFYNKKFKGTKEFTAEEQAENDVKAERGTQFHKDMENMFRLFIDPITGRKKYSTQAEKNAIDISGFIPEATLSGRFKEEYIDIIAGYVKDKLDTYSDEARFLFETVVSNPGKEYDVVQRNADGSEKKGPDGKPLVKKVTGLVGTVDFIVIDHKGIDILDWKSIYSLSEDGRIYPTKKQGFNIQLNEYYNALKYSADISDQEFNEVRVIPVLPVLNDSKQITKLTIGKVRPTDDAIGILPVLSDKDKAFRGTIRPMLDSINEILRQENKRFSKESGYKNAEDWELKRDVEEAITQIIVQKNPDEFFLFVEDILARADKYIKEVDAFNRDGKVFSEEDRIIMQDKLRNASTNVEGLKDFLTFAEDNLSEYAQSESGKEKIGTHLIDIEKKRIQVRKINGGLMNKLAESRGITGITKPQREIGMFKKWTTFFRSNPATKTVQAFSKFFGDTVTKTVQEQEDAKYKFLNLKEGLKAWGKKNNQKLEDIYKSFIDSSNPNDERQFQLKNKIDFAKLNKDRKAAFSKVETKEAFLSDNYDLDAYKIRLDEFLADEDAKIDAKTYSTDEEIDNKKKSIAKSNLRKKYKVDKTTSVQLLEENWLLHSIDRNTGEYLFFKDVNFHSDFYKDLLANKPKLDFYNHLLAINRRTKATGLVEDKFPTTFIPHIYKGFLETGGDLKAQWRRYLTSININPNSHETGNINPISGLPEQQMFIPYVYDLSKEVNGKKDFSELSIDLGKVFASLEQEVIDVENKQDLESLFILLRDLEDANKVININKWGNAQFEDANKTTLSTSSKGKSSQNYQYLDKFGSLILYGQSLQDLKDVSLPTGMKDKEGNPITVSGVKIVQEVASIARAGAFGGLNIVAPLRNFVMGRLSTIVQESPYFSSTISYKNYIGFLEEMKFDLTNKKHNKIAASIAYFLPNILPKGQYVDNMDMNSGYQILTQENMFKLIRKSEEFVRIPIHLALVDNSTVRDGAIVNINELVRKEFKEKYKTDNIYKYIHLLPKDQARKMQKEMKDRIKDLQKNDNLWSYMEISPEGEMKIKGVERNHPSVAKMRNITENIISKATGSVTQDNANLASTSFLARQLGMFRTWIPRTVQSRFGELTPNNLDESIDEGRMRSLAKMIIKDHQTKFKTIGKLLAGFVGIHDKKHIVDVIKRLYEDKTQRMITLNQIDRKSDISEEEFTQLYLNNIQAAYNDLRATSILLLLAATGILLAGEGGDDDEKNLRRTLQREIAKYSQEFTFYYSPSSAIEIIKSPFPILNYHSNVAKLFTHTAKATWGAAFDDEVYEKATPTKYLLKSIPLTNFFVSYLPLFDSELAKDWNVRINPNYLFNR